MITLTLIAIAIIAIFTGSYLNIKKNIPYINSIDAVKEALPRTIAVVMILIGLFLIFKEMMK